MTQPDWNGLLKEFNREPPAAPNTIADFESKSRIRLPEDYKSFLMLSNGGEGFVGTEDEYIILWPVNELIHMNEAYGFTEYAPHLYIFGSNGGGEAFAFDLRSDEMPIVAVPFLAMDEEDQVRPVARNIGAFLEGHFPWGDGVNESST